MKLEEQVITKEELANNMEGQAVPKEEQVTSRVLGASITLKEKAIVTLLFMKLAKKPRTAL